MSSWKESMINRLSNLINRNRSAAKISHVLCSSNYVFRALVWDVVCVDEATSSKPDQQILRLNKK